MCCALEISRFRTFIVLGKVQLVLCSQDLKNKEKAFLLLRKDKKHFDGNMPKLLSNCCFFAFKVIVVVVGSTHSRPCNSKCSLLFPVSRKKCLSVFFSSIPDELV